MMRFSFTYLFVLDICILVHLFFVGTIVCRGGLRSGEVTFGELISFEHGMRIFEPCNVLDVFIGVEDRGLGILGCLCFDLISLRDKDIVFQDFEEVIRLRNGLVFFMVPPIDRIIWLI